MVTSPPYYNLRDYGVDGQLGLEASPDDYIANLVAVFREVRRVLRDDGTVWLNLGDSYSAGGRGGGGKQATNKGSLSGAYKTEGLEMKQLLMIPARVVIALQADGWYLRSDIIWHKPNPMPESVRDRPTSSHEHVFLLSKSPQYYYDADSISEPCKIESAKRYAYDFPGSNELLMKPNGRQTHPKGMREFKETRNCRNVWEINSKPHRGAHFATMPLELAEKCVKAGSKPRDIILDPFGGAGTTGQAAINLDRDFVLIELNPDYCVIAEDRLGMSIINLP